MRWHLAIVGWLMLAFAAGCPGETPGDDDDTTAGNPEIPQPNVILITADDLGWRELSSYGNGDIATPGIDRLADEGVRFENAFVVASSCSPSRASLITGQYPHTNGVMGLTNMHTEMQLPEGYPTLPLLLSEAGYHTGLEGKWHVSPFHLPEEYGYVEHLSGLLPDDHWILDTEVTLDFLQRNADQRFYLELNYMNTHRLGDNTFEYHPDHPVDPDAITVPEYWALPDWPEIREDLAMYYSQAMRMDAMIGEVLDELDALGIAEDTLVVFLSDNGPPYPGLKTTLYDRGTGTPLLVRWPRRFGGQQVRGGFINSIDVMPTILEAVGVEVPVDVQGISFLSILDAAGAAPIRTEIFTEMTYHEEYLPTRAARTADVKYIRNYSDAAVGLGQCAPFIWAHELCEEPDQPWIEPRVEEELYDLTSDPNEKTNLVGDGSWQATLDSMRVLLDDHLEATGDPYLDEPFTHDFEPIGED